MLARGAAQSIRDEEFSKLFGSEFLVNNQQAALYLQVSESTLNHWRSGGGGPRFVKLGASRGAVRYRMSDLRAFIESRVYSSTAEAEIASAAMSRVSDVLTDWDCEHPFVVRNRWFVVDSAYADRESYISIFRDPFVKLAWLKPREALALPWVREDHRQNLLHLFLANQNDREEALQKVSHAYQTALAKVPDINYGSHPELTLEHYGARLEATLHGLRR